MRNNPNEIRAMVEDMVKIAHDRRVYDVHWKSHPAERSSEAVTRYPDLSAEPAHR